MADRVDPLALQMREQFEQMAIDLFGFWVDFLVPPDSANRRQIVLHETLDEETEWYFLEETNKKWLMWQNGEIPGDSDIVAFDQNVDGAQERLLELREKFTDDPEVIDG